MKQEKWTQSKKRGAVQTYDEYYGKADDHHVLVNSCFCYYIFVKVEGGWCSVW